MSLVLAGKIFGGVLFTGASSIAIGYMMLVADYKKEGAETETTNIYAINQNFDNKITDANKKFTKKEYGCKLNFKYYDCEIQKVADFDTTKKWIDISGLITKKNDEITISSLKTDTNVYKIIIKNRFDWTANQGKIEIIKKAWYEGEKYAELKALFALNHDNLVNEHTTTKHFIVKTGTSVDSSLTSSETYKCLTSSNSTIDSSTNATEDCKIYEFAANSSTETDLKSLNFKTLVSGTKTTLASNKYYVVQLNDIKKTEEVRAMKIQQIQTTSGTNTTKDISIENEIIAAVYLQEKDDNLFILKELNQTTAVVGGGTNTGQAQNNTVGSTN